MWTTQNPKPNDSFLGLPEDIWGPKREPLIIVIPITVLYGIILFLGCFGNIITCAVIIRNKYMHTVTNYYLLSLAVSDLVLLIVGLPSEIYQMWHKYPYMFNETACIMQGLAAETSSNATVLTITAFTIERYIAISYPFFSHKSTKLRRAVRYIILIWILSFIFAIPQAAQMGLVYGKDELGNGIEELSMCALKYSFIPYSFEISMILFFVTPMSVITVLYILIGIKLYKPSIAAPENRKPILIPAGSRKVVTHQCVLRPDPTDYMTHSKSTKRVVKMLVAVVVTFFICWAPFQTQRLLAVHGYKDNMSKNMFLLYEIVTYISGILYYFSTVINPILYNIMSNKFRRAFHDTITICLQSETTINRRRNSGEIGSSDVPRLNYNANRHRNSCSKNSSILYNPFMTIMPDASQRPIVISFRKQQHSDHHANMSLPSNCPQRVGSLHGIPNKSVSLNNTTFRSNPRFMVVEMHARPNGHTFYSE